MTTLDATSTPRTTPRTTAQTTAQLTAPDGSLEGLTDSRGRNVGTLSADFRRSVLMLSRRLRSEKISDDISDAQMSVLVNLIRNGPASPSELARREHVKPPSMTRMLASLEGLELIARGSNASDGRGCIVELTAAGAEFVHRTRRLRQQWLVGRLGELDDADLEILAAAVPLLQRIVAPAASDPNPHQPNPHQPNHPQRTQLPELQSTPTAESQG